MRKGTSKHSDDEKGNKKVQLVSAFKIQLLRKSTRNNNRLMSSCKHAAVSHFHHE
jgi:hypothetical protein